MSRRTVWNFVVLIGTLVFVPPAAAQEGLRKVRIAYSSDTFYCLPTRGGLT